MNPELMAVHSFMKWLDEEIQVRQNSLVFGAVADYAQYREAIGQIRAFTRAQIELQDRIKKSHLDSPEGETA